MKLLPSSVKWSAAESTKELEKRDANKLARGWPLLALVETALIILGLLANLLLFSHNTGPDGQARYSALSAFLQNGTIPHIKYSMVGPFFSIPFWYLGKVYQTPFWWATRYNVFILGGGLLAMYWLLKDRVDRALLRKFFLLLVVASMFGHHLFFYYGEVFTAVFVTVGCVAVVAGPALVGWCAIVLGVVNTPVTLVGLLLLTGKHMVERRSVRYILAVIAAGALIALESWIFRGSPLATGYADDYGFRTIMPYSGLPGFSNPLFFGLLSLLFSFGKGIFFFAPGLLLPIRRTLRKVREETRIDLFAIYMLWICFLVGLLLVYSSWWAWYGGWFWGPRFLLIASVPASFALAARLHWRDASLPVNILTIVILALSVWVGIDGVVYGDAVLRDVCVANHYYLELPLCYYTPEFSVLWHPFVVPQAIDSEQLLYMLYCIFVGIYLLVPLLITTAGQLYTAILDLTKWLDLRSWKI